MKETETKRYEYSLVSDDARRRCGTETRPMAGTLENAGNRRQELRSPGKPPGNKKQITKSRFREFGPP